MALTNVKLKLKNLSQLDLDLVNGRNDLLFSIFDDVVRETVDYINDKSIEDGLVNEFINTHEKLKKIFSKKINNISESHNNLNRQLESEKNNYENTLDEFKKWKSNFNSNDENVLKMLKGQDDLDKLNLWRSSFISEECQVEELKVKLNLLNDELALNELNNNNLKRRYRLYYNFLSSALRIIVIDEENDLNVEIALVTNYVGDSWNRIKIPLSDTNINSCDNLWDIIQQSFKI